MPLTFECPDCGRFCAADETLAGRPASCNNCGSRFFVPQTQGRKPRPAEKPPSEPLAGFYRAALAGNWAGLFHPKSSVGLLFCITMTILQLIAGNADYSFTMGAFRTQLWLGWVVQVLSFGSLFWYFFRTVMTASTKQNSLPDFDIGFGFEFFGNVIKAVFLFLNAILIAFLPFMVVGVKLSRVGIDNSVVSLILFFGGCFLLPMEVGILACELPMWTVFRFDLILRAIVKTFRPYLLTAVIVLACFWIYFLTIGLFADEPGIAESRIYFYAAARAAAMILMLFCLRVIGLYCRHYSTAAPWLWSKTSL